jgi:TIGR03009 family protein
MRQNRMTNSPLRFWIAPLIVATCGSFAAAQPQQQAPQQPVAGQPGQPAGFPLNPMQQAFLDQVLISWQNESAKVTIFQCPFERWEYNQAFGPGNGLPLYKNKGELGYQKPDKGSFEVTEVRVWEAKPAPAAQPGQANGDWVEKEDAIGEHWVCDGANVYEYRTQQKQLVVRPIPPEMRGKAIVDGPLPFLFGAEAAKLKVRYWMRAEQNQQDPNTIFLSAFPKLAQVKMDYQQVDVMLDRTKMMPKAMQVHLPNGDRHVYIFQIADAKVNGHLQRIMALFQAPRTPFGWERVVEAAPPAQPPAMLEGRQAAQPDALPR